MARAFSGVLAGVGVAFIIVRGLLVGALPDAILSQCIGMILPFAALGYFIGFAAEKTIRESVENRFRSEMAALHKLVDKATADNAEQSDSQS